MAFDQNMIIDAIRGSIARFVNHSCAPNCRMEKWTVGGKPRMALFADDRGIMTGEELTFDSNFDPNSSKSVHVCRCGSENCRGMIGLKAKNAPKKSAMTAGAEERRTESWQARRGRLRSPWWRAAISLTNDAEPLNQFRNDEAMYLLLHQYHWRSSPQQASTAHSCANYQCSGWRYLTVIRVDHYEPQQRKTPRQWEGFGEYQLRAIGQHWPLRTKVWTASRTRRRRGGNPWR